MKPRNDYISKRVRIKFKDNLDVFEGIITFFKNKGIPSVTRTPTPQYCFRLNDAEKTEIVFEFYNIDTISYL